MHTYSMELGGRTLTMEIGKIAKQANGAVLVRYGDTAVVVAVTGTKTPREGVDFFPLTVDFEEKMYAVGKIPGGFIKREGRPGEQAILTSRLIDRPIRPMFPDGYHNDVQIVATAVSVALYLFPISPSKARSQVYALVLSMVNLLSILLWNRLRSAC